MMLLLTSTDRANNNRNEVPHGCYFYAANPGSFRLFFNPVGLLTPAECDRRHGSSIGVHVDPDQPRADKLAYHSDVGPDHFGAGRTGGMRFPSDTGRPPGGVRQLGRLSQLGRR